jgi:ligand-binding SRPBCC domain-containing protein
LITTPYSFTVESSLRASPERLWDHASSFREINRELWPLRMTHPLAVPRLTPETIPLGRRAFRSWILLFGFIPVEYDDFTIVELDPGRGFSEVSRLFTMREWRHRRTLVPTSEGCLVRDEIGFIPRWRIAGPMLFQLYHLAFKRRHKVLRRLFGAAGG